jgi:uncharacterized repeat protein (TIGR01451 family)
VTYTIVLRNASPDPASAQVVDHLPAGVTYVIDSAEPTASYDQGTKILAWQDVGVPAQDEVSLTFAVVAAQVTAQATVINRAVISADGTSLERIAPILLVPDPVEPPSGLATSHRLVSPCEAGPGETLTYTIILVNSGPAQVSAWVTDLLPGEVAYVPGSAQPQAVHSGESQALSWAEVKVPAGGEVALSYTALARQVYSPTTVVNTAMIATDGGVLERIARTLLLPQSPEPDCPLAGSRISVSPYVAGPGEELAYTLLLRNDGPVEAIARVTDHLPAEVVYVPRSAWPIALYDEQTRTLTWPEARVPAGSEMSLTFLVTATEIASPTITINTTVIASDDTVVERRTKALLVLE